MAGYPPDTVTVNADNRLAILRNKQGALQELFGDVGKLFEVQSYDGTAPLKFIPRVAKITFEAGNWVELCNYRIEMECDFITFGTISQPAAEFGDDDVQDSWSIEQSDERGHTFKMSHTVTAQANDLYNGDGTGALVNRGWEVAQLRGLAHLGMDSTVKNNYFGGGILDSFNAYNHAVQENIDEGEGRYTATETWVLNTGNYIEDYTISTRHSLADGLTTVAIEGTVTGLSTSDFGFGDRYTNAVAALVGVQGALYSRATTVSGITLNITPFNFSVGNAVTNGVISYNYEYNNRFNNRITGALSENISLQDSIPADIFAIHRVVARPAGPILQDIGTNTEQRRTLLITANMQPAINNTLASVPISAEIASIIVDYSPTGYVQGPYVERNEVTFDYYTGRYTRTVSWVWC